MSEIKHYDAYDGKRRLKGRKEKHFHDIALIVLAKDLPFGPAVMPICLPIHRRGSRKGYKGKVGYVAGWGAPKWNERMVESPRVAEVEIYSRARWVKHLVQEEASKLSQEMASMTYYESVLRFGFVLKTSKLLHCTMYILRPESPRALHNLLDHPNFVAFYSLAFNVVTFRCAKAWQVKRKATDCICIVGADKKQQGTKCRVLLINALKHFSFVPTGLL